MNYYLKYTIAAVVVALAIPAAAAGGGGSGLVRSIIVTTGGVVIFTMDIHTGAPACSGVDAFKNDFAIDGSTVHGKNTYALLLAAANQKKPVTVVGTGACSVWPFREDVNYLFVTY